MKKLVLMILGLYRRAVSPALGPCCRFEPSCSAYVEEAVVTHGVLAGLRLGAWRILRCHPFARAGFDPVPPRMGAWARGRTDVRAHGQVRGQA